MLLSQSKNFKRTHPGRYATKLGRLQRYLEVNPIRAPNLRTPTATFRLQADAALPDWTSRYSFVSIADTRIGKPTSALLNTTGITGALNDGVQRAYHQIATNASGNDKVVPFEVTTNADYIGVMISGTAFVTATIDGELVQTVLSYSTGNNRICVIGDGRWTTKTYSIICRSGQGVAGIWIDDRANIVPPKTDFRLVVGVLADSYGQRNGANAPYSLGYGLARLMGGTGYSDPQGGTGFYQVNGGYPNFLTRVGSTTFPSGLNPNVVYCLGGINDPDNATLTTNATAVAAALRALWPDVVIVYCGPWCPDGTAAQTPGGVYPNKRDKIKASLATDPGPWAFIDPLTDGWNNSAGASSAGSGQPWTTGSTQSIANLTFTSAALAATSATLTSNWTGTTGAYNVLFADGNVRSVTLTNGATTATWTGSVDTSNYATIIANAAGSFAAESSDATHLNQNGTDRIAMLLATRSREAMLAL